MSMPLEDFFARFVSLGFKYQGNLTSHINFVRLCKVLRKNKNSEVSESIIRPDFDDARVQQFNYFYGTESNLEAWQNLCCVLNITPVPGGIKKCKKRVWDINVNIVDLIEAGRTGDPVQTFATLEELREYTLKPGNIIPKDNAYAGGLLKDLLREISKPYYGKRQNANERRKKIKEARKEAGAKRSSS